MERMRQTLTSFWKPALAILVAIVISAVVLTVAGYDAWKAFEALWNATFRNLKSFGNTLNKASPLLFTGVAVAVSFRCNVFNIGTEGQFLMGAIAATCVGIVGKGLPGIVLVILMFLAGAAAGAAWGFLPGWLKARHGVSEVITTIMFNYIAMQFLGYLVRGPLRDTSQAEPQSFPIADQGFLHYIISGTRLHIGFFLGSILAIVMYLWLFRTYYGYEVRSVGFNATAARCGGVNVKRTMVQAMLMSGAIAGLGGAIELAGNAHYLFENLSPGYGYTAIAVSILASNNPIGVIFSALLFGFLNAGSTAMQRAADVSASFVNIFQGIVIVFVALAAISKKHSKGRAAKGGA
ncbi:MAG: ABC transporter permease [Oscillospiraceae bacterium]|nr:ABC transporter permease [Oscillospiraceae bacterium]